MFNTIFYQLNVLGQMTGYVLTNEGRIFVLRRSTQTNKLPSGKEAPHQWDPSTQHVGKGVQIAFDPEVIALMPVMAASTLRLAHASFACLRIMKAKVFTGGLAVLGWLYWVGCWIT
jgi:hypothetical protein